MNERTNERTNENKTFTGYMQQGHATDACQ